MIDLRRTPVDCADMALAGEVGDIVAALRGRDVAACVRHLAALVARPRLTLPHPEDAGVATTARTSLRVARYNLVFFAADDGGHRWILVQFLNLVDGIVTERGTGYVFEKHRDGIGRMLEMLRRNGPALDALFGRTDPFDGLIVSHRTPFHFFYDFYKYLVQVAEPLQAAGKGAHVLPDQLFFPFESIAPGLAARPVADNVVYLYATGVQQNVLNALGLAYSEFIWFLRRDRPLPTKPGGDAVGAAMKRLERQVRRHAIRTPPALPDIPSADPRGFTVVIGVSDEKRAWTGQIDGFARLIDQYAILFPDLTVVFDGMTASAGARLDSPREQDNVERIRARLTRPVRIHSIIGMDYAAKVAVVDRADFFVCDAGTAAMVPLRFCRKPGVVFSNGHVYSFPDDYAGTLACVPAARIEPVPVEQPGGRAFVSFHMRWQDVYNTSLPVLARAFGVVAAPLPPDP